MSSDINKNKITRLEVAVHLFDWFDNHPERKSHKCIGHREQLGEYEDLMRDKYCRRIRELADDPGSHIVFVPHSSISRGYLNPGSKSVFREIMERMGLRYTTYDSSVTPEGLKKIKGRIDESTRIAAWGEMTTGCVLRNLVLTYMGVGIDPDIDMIKQSLDPECGIDFKHGYPKPWETRGKEDNTKRLQTYEKAIMHNFGYFTGKENSMPYFQ